jgi:hypothetical protein
MQGVPLEEDGGDGTSFSHWEKTLVASETMGPVDFINPKLGGITLSFLEDMGYYKSDFDFEEDWTFGKGGGCDFVTGTC